MAAIFLVGLAALRLPMPLVVTAPGPTTDVAELIQIKAPTYESKGSYLLTTALISSPDGVTLPEAISVFFDPDKELISRESIFPSDSTRVNTDRVHAAQMTESQEEAAVAALHEIGKASAPEGVFVRDVDVDVPAAGKLFPGDVIVAVEGTKILDSKDLVEAVEGRPAGETVTVSVRRKGRDEEIEVGTFESRDRKDRGKTKLGVLAAPKRTLPVEISIEAGRIGGPSAGLIFAVAIYDALTPGDLTDGREIAGTGGIANPEDRMGAVTSVGAVGEKVIAAGRKGVDVFLVPKANLREAQDAASGGLRVIGVSTLREAIKALGD